MHIVIIGGGASGMFYALMRKKYHPQDEVTLLEKEARLGRKLLATGNGKGNLGHSGDINPYTYRHFDWTNEMRQRVSPQMIQEELTWLGLDLKDLANGMWYPLSESTKTVLDVFTYRLKQLGVNVLTNTRVEDYSYQSQRWSLQTTNGLLSADRLIVATGGKASPKLGADASIYALLAQHGYHITSLAPGLVALHVQEDIKLLDGLRLKATVSLYQDQHLFYREAGEVQFKRDGISGIVVMNLASLIARAGIDRRWTIALDFFPERTVEELVAYWERKEQQGYPFLDGSLIAPLAREIEKRTHTRGFKSKEEKTKVAQEAKQFMLTFTSFYGFEEAQVTVGGVDLTEVTSTLASKREKEVYLLGEVLDNDGLCGGWNLLWAWMSALIAAKEDE